MSSNALQILCMPCLDAFGLTLDPEITGSDALRFLKNDDASIVVKARCKEKDTVRDFVLKGTPFSFYRQSSAMTAIENALGANDKGIIVPARRLTVAGKDIHITTESSTGAQTVWSVTTFEPNAPSFDWLQSLPLWTESHTYSAGVLLAKTHAATGEIKTRLLASNCPIETSIITHVPELVLHAFESVEADCLERLGTQTRDYVRLVAILCKAVLNLEKGLHAKTLEAEEVIVHGDFQPGNVLYQEDKACGLIDWDYARLDNPLMDLAYGLIMYAYNLSSEEASALDTKLSCRFLQGYTDQIAKNGRKPACMPDCDFTPASRDHGVFSDYMKVSAALILLWSLSEYGQKHRFGVTVGRRILRLIQAL
jgi:hypothetical protein